MTTNFFISIITKWHYLPNEVNVSWAQHEIILHDYYMLRLFSYKANIVIHWDPTSGIEMHTSLCRPYTIASQMKSANASLLMIIKLHMPQYIHITLYNDCFYFASFFRWHLVLGKLVVSHTVFDLSWLIHPFLDGIQSEIRSSGCLKPFQWLFINKHKHVHTFASIFLLRKVSLIIACLRFQKRQSTCPHVRRFSKESSILFPTAVEGNNFIMAQFLVHYSAVWTHQSISLAERESRT